MQKPGRSNLQPGRTSSYTVGEVAGPCRTASKFSRKTRSSLPSFFSFSLLISHKLKATLRDEEGNVTPAGWRRRKKNECGESRNRIWWPCVQAQYVLRCRSYARPVRNYGACHPRGPKRWTRSARSPNFIREVPSSNLVQVTGSTLICDFPSILCLAKFRPVQNRALL